LNITASDLPAADTQRYRRGLFLLTICAGSLLLFLVQPMIARMALPRLGGAPAVWNSAMLVYQALLLGGYAYAHWLSRFLPRKQAMIHLGLFCVAAIMLPIGLSTATPDSQSNPVLWVPWLLLTSIGPLFFVVSAQAPLMQRWFALSGGENPYPLYAASNLGSFAGLIAYPLLVEPLLETGSQSLLWSAGYAVVAALTLACALRLPRSTIGASAAPPTAASAPPRLRTMLPWIVFSAIASGLMLSTTMYLTTDVAAMPLLWVIPLGLYLISFSVAFAENRALSQLMAKLAPISLVFAAFTTFIGTGASSHGAFILVVQYFFVLCCALHARLFDSRPSPEHLTRFYLAMSVGGVIGGIFCALLAPLIFDWTYEHPILLIAAALALGHEPLLKRSGEFWQRKSRSRPLLIGLCATMLLLSMVAGEFFGSVPFAVQVLIALAIAIAAMFFAGHRLLFAAAVIACMLSMSGWKTLQFTWNEGLMTRSYFGVYWIQKADEDTVKLVHGTTVHGAQMRAESLRLVPPGYYTPSSGIGMAFNAVPALFGDKARVSVIGLGTGALVCYGRPGETWKFYEIDPAIESIARDPRNFSFISGCRPDLDVVIGDARLTIAAAPPASADVLVIDAFSSDAIPTHLLTQEAFETYRRYLAPGGLLVVHISNKFLDLSPVIASVAADKGWTARIRSSSEEDEKRTDLAFYSSVWVVMSQDPAKIDKIERLSGSDTWREIRQTPDFERWTDSHSSTLPLLMKAFLQTE
jgi:SAM-dependent methyltransferase